ncbi:TPM domain-containing protein [Heyndrickxia sp. NPDC080065]|uniref:TPM domain-containing protein n=1 Tax=Heyndrickxia sp. NPDC080065 TaxID=3390568 RepID=UPI003D03264A
MKKTLLGIAVIVFMAISMLGSKVNAEIPTPKGDIYVQDFSKVLSVDEKNELITLGRQLEDQTKAQIAVLTIPTLEGQDIASYANRAFRKYQLGDKKLNNGVLLLLATKDQEIRIEVGYGLEGALPDGKVGRILNNYALPYLKENKTNAAIVNTYKELLNVVANEYHLDNIAQPKPYKESQTILSYWKVILITIGIIILIIIDTKYFGGTLTYLLINILSAFMRSGGGGGGNRGGGGGSSGGGGGSSGGGGASRKW